LDIEVMDRTFKKFADSSPEAAQKVIDALKAQLAVTDPSSRSFQDLTDAIARYEGQLIVTRLAQGGLNDELRETQSLQEVIFGVQLKATLSKYDDLRANNANADSLKKFQREVHGLTEATKSGTSATEKLAQAKAKLKSSTDAVGSAQITNRNAGERLQSAEKSLTQATTDAAAARDRLRVALRGYGTDSKEAAAASRTLAGAQRDLQRSQRGVETALRNVAEAEKRLADLRNKAADPNEVMNAEFGLEKSKLDVEEATLAVSDAEEALAKTLADPDASPRDKRKAELALVSAKFALRDSIISAGEAEREVIATRATGATAEELAEAERALEDAKLSVADALDSQTTALENLNIQQENYRKVTEGINEQDEEFLKLSAEIVKADEDQATAAIGVRDAREAAAKATTDLKEAEEQLRLSRKELRVAGGKPPGRAFGGPVTGARPYIVGERGPELFVPNSSGTIVPNSRMGGGGTSIVINVNSTIADAELPQKLVDALRTYNRNQGPLNVQIL
jgi:DNA repair exonuclease SbcCD ATPase subunit